MTLRDKSQLVYTHNLKMQLAHDKIDIEKCNEKLHKNCPCKQALTVALACATRPSTFSTSARRDLDEDSLLEGFFIFVHVLCH